jgi:hypothetical protein
MPMPCRILLVVVFCLWLGGNSAFAQPRVAVLAGGGFSFVTSGAATVVYKHLEVPYASVQLWVPVTERVTFETGISYEPQGFRTYDDRVEIDSPYIYSDQYYGLQLRHYCTLPLTVSVTCLRGPGTAVSVGSGLRYGLLWGVGSRYLVQRYRDGHLRENTTRLEQTESRIGLMQSAANPIDYYSFSTFFDAHAQVVWRDRYLFRAAYSIALNDADASPNPGTFFRLQTLTTSLGIILGKPGKWASRGALTYLR